MNNLNNFLIISDPPENNKQLVEIGPGTFSNYSPVIHRDHFCFFHGIIHNYDELASMAGKSTAKTEEVLIELYLGDTEKFPGLLEGNFSLVIGNKDYFYLLRDGNGYENLYFKVSSSDPCRFLIGNSIKEISGYHTLEVNRDILPGYFIKTDINSGETFFRDFQTPGFFEYVIIRKESLKVERGFFEEFFMRTESTGKVRIKKIINEFDALFGSIIHKKFNQLNPHFKIVNSLSGGTDSTFIQYFLKKNGSVIAYTANYLKAGEDHNYASDVSALMGLNHKTVHSDTEYLVDCMPKGIYLAEKPFLFAGEALLFHMYEGIGRDFNGHAACFDGAGAEGILGASRILYELRIIRKYRFIFGLILPLIRLRSRKLFKRYREFHRYVNGKTIPDQFILRYFTDGKVRDIVMEAFNLHDLAGIDDYEQSMMKNYNASLFESVYRFLSFELEYKRVNNMRTQLAKNNGIFLVFPFTETRLFKYLIRIDTELKLRKAKTKYIFRKAMEKKFPANIIYRKKIRKNVSVYGALLQDEKTRRLIGEIKGRNYPYFNFDYDKIFGSPEFSAVSYKLINFHIWHKLFIEKRPYNTFWESEKNEI